MTFRASSWTPPAPVNRALARGKDRLSVPLYRNGYALVAGSWLTSALGLLYWIVAARAFTPEAVGIGAALISAMTVITAVAQLNLKSALNRFLPAAGRGSARMVRNAYAVALGSTAIFSVVFLAGIGLWAPDLAFVAERPLLALWFIAGTLGWTIFVLQDSVLAGLRQAVWVPLENGVYAVAKIAFLVLLAGPAGTLGVYLAWTMPLLAIIAPINWLLFRRLIPRHAAAPDPPARPGASIARYVAADSVAYVVWSATIGALPLVVMGVAGPEATGVFFIAWAMAYALYLVSSGMGMSLLAEGSRDESGLEQDARRMVAASAQIVVPAALAMCVAAPLVLSLMGKTYAADAALLRLLALSAIPYMVVVTSVTVARVRRQMGTVVATYAALCALVLAIGVPLLHALGTVGLGYAWLSAQTLVAAVTVARFEVVRTALTKGLSDLVASARLFGARTAISSELPRLARALGAKSRSWTLLRVFRTDGDVAVSAVGNGHPEAIVKRAVSAQGEQVLTRGRYALLARRMDTRTPRFGDMIPRMLAAGKLRGRGFVAESALPGVSGEELLAAGTATGRAYARGAGAMAQLYRATSEPEVIGPRLLDAWVHRPLEVLNRITGYRNEEAVRGLERELCGALAGRTVNTCVTHGDLWPGNLLYADDGSAVTGIVDWERSSASGNASIDLMHLYLTTRMSADGSELGTVVRELLGSDLDDHEPLSAGPYPERAALILAWLQHVAGTATNRSRVGQTWIRRNVNPVLDLWAPPAARPWRPSSLALGLGGLVTALVVWAGSISGVDPREMTDGGLLTVLPWTFGLAVVILTLSFSYQVFRDRSRNWLLGAHLGALIAIIHATPIIVYGTLRYSWAWKHVGVIDFIQRNGAVDTGSQYLTAYHNWPGFFGIDAVATDLAGLPDALGLALWGPPFFTALTVAALAFVWGGFENRREVVWLGCWVFVAVNWIGQEYFSPQAFAFFLYLVLIGVVVRWLDRPRPWAYGLAIAIVAAIAVSHPLTSVMAPFVLFVLLAVGRCAYRSLPFVAAAVVVVWCLTFASDYVLSNIASTADSIDFPWQTTGDSLAETSALSDTQALIATVSRVLVAAVCALAALGVVRLLRSGARPYLPLALALAPLTLFATGSYEGEILFRVYLFGLPFLSYLAAFAFLPREGSRRGTGTWLGFAAAASVLVAALFVAHYGKDHQNFYSEDEIAASRYVYQNAPQGSLLVEGSRTYPGQFENYERFEYVTLSREPHDSQARVIRRPAAVLSEWMTDNSRAASYLIITESQKAEIEEQGTMAPRSLERIESALAGSPLFRTVLENRDAVVFAPARGRSG